MSLFVHDPRSRGKSPGRERSRSRARSRDGRVPSPPEVRPKYSFNEPSRKSSKKYLSDEESDLETRSRKPSKKYYDDDSLDSDSGNKSKKSSKKYYDDDSSDSDSRSRRKKSSTKYYDDLSDKNDSDSGSDRRKPKSRSAKPKYEIAEPKHRRTSPPDTHSSALTRKGEYVQSSKLHYDREHQEGRHANYASPDRQEPGRPSGYTRHESYSNGGPEHRSPGTTLPGQYKWEYDHPSESHDRDHRSQVTSRPEQTRHLSMSTTGNFNVNIGAGHNPQPQYGHTISPQYTGQPPHTQFTQSSQPQYRPENHRTHSGSMSSANQYSYADPQPLTYNVKSEARKPSYTQSAQPQFVEVKPHTSALLTSPTEGLGSKLHRLSVSGGVAGGALLGAPSQGHGHTQGGLPPGSPLLEAYHGTYQSISPMPSPLILPSTMDDDLSDLDPLSSRYSSDDGPRGFSQKSRLTKRVAFYDPEEDALALAAALNHSKPDPGPIIKVLPRLSGDNVLQLRTEYKKHIKVNGKGINIAKHIKMKVPGNLGKIAYAVALGRWESEAHWANFWYQSNSSRRELLIESLIGRTNGEIVKIKEAFSDKRYNDSLEKCMQTELKKDKFRNAILLALEEKRMPETEKLSIELVQRDAQDLYRALVAKEGGETAMINIIVVRSDNHLREVLRVFEGKYRKNFAREMIQKSRNLVGETLAHILNGVLNRPVRDALLLHQALAETSKDRTELLVSRLVRFHWEPRHFEKIKVEYRNKYGSKLEHHIDEGTKGEFGAFCIEICKGQK
ncbi:hypothetical protein MMC07_000698 [Pseudocyphellaria aurata]|nr:hypothetical protein [Pseudocyphellaria aurata]